MEISDASGDTRKRYTLLVKIELKMRFVTPATKLSARKLSFLGITMVFVVWCLYRRRFDINDKEAGYHVEQRNITLHLDLSPEKEPENITNVLLSSVVDVQDKRRGEEKFIMAFSYWEQLTQATASLIHLTALAAHGGRQVVVPFVKHSKFYGAMKNAQTLSLYFNVTELNRELQVSGHGTLVDWNKFRDVCKDQLDVLVDFHFTRRKPGTFNSATGAFPCTAPRMYQNLQINSVTCVYAPALHSVETFENEIVKKHPCVGIMEWRGNQYPGRSPRAQFNFSSIVNRPLSFGNVDAFFNVKLKHIAQDFIARDLRPDFFSVHIRAESILFHGGNIDLVVKCMLELSAAVKMMTNSTVPELNVFLATDFSQFGSSSRSASLRKNAKSLMELLEKNLNPIAQFQPKYYSLSDHGAVAIVEMDILASGRRLFVLGGGSFQGWIRQQFLKRKNNDLTLINSFCKQI